jgi:hypothetical protein
LSLLQKSGDEDSTTDSTATLDAAAAKLAGMQVLEVCISKHDLLFFCENMQHMH